MKLSRYLVVSRLDVVGRLCLPFMVIGSQHILCRETTRVRSRVIRIYQPPPHIVHIQVLYPRKCYEVGMMSELI